MTISSTTSRWEYTGDGSNTGFAVNNKFFADSDLEVYEDGVLQTLTTHYTVTGAGNDAGGTVTFVSAPANNAEVTIIRNVPDTQTTDLPAAGAFPSTSVEDALDRRTVVSQQGDEALSRSLKFLSTDQNLPSAELPALASLKGKALTFNSSTGAPEATAFADISVSIDTLLTSEAANDFLVYDGTNWVNQTLAETKTTLGVGGALAAKDTIDNANLLDAGVVDTSELADEAVTNAKLAHIATARIKGRTTASTGDVEDLTAAQVLSLLGYSSATSSELAIPSAGATATFAHGLGALPNDVQVFLRCTTADSPFAVGENIPVTTHISIDGTSEFGMMAQVDATNVKVIRGANAANIYNSSNGNAFAITDANWRLVIVARILP